MPDFAANQHPVNIEDEMKRSYMDYAMSVIIGRALPDVRDGLKPAHRRVLYGMTTMGLSATRGYRKCAKIVGEVMGNFHPHGDASIYDTLVRLAQDFNMRYPLVDGRTVVDLALDPARDFYLAVGSGLGEQPARQVTGRGPVIPALRAVPIGRGLPRCVRPTSGTALRILRPARAIAGKRPCGHASESTRRCRAYAAVLHSRRQAVAAVRRLHSENAAG